MKLLLSSNEETAIENLNKLTDKQPEDLKIAWVITAAMSGEGARFLNKSLECFRKHGYKPSIIDIHPRYKEYLLEELPKFDVLFVDGGNTFFLLRRIRETGLEQFIREWVNEKPYVGVSAGSYIMCPTIEMATWKNPDRDRHGLDNLEGLGIVDYLITAHYKDEYEPFIKKGMENSKYKLRRLRDGEFITPNPPDTP